MVNIIGNGQIAQEFKSKEKLDDAIIFASGVADSNSLDEKFFDRERTLIEVNVELSKTTAKTFYELKPNGRIEYGSLPANVDLDKVIKVLTPLI